ncbi:hypothetical protein BDM02DRAFT_3189139 [Thelephora ganbajun]|uniref:Uncharacterized protein n=1 Tax=Thelephora ganbajun TaxID=370292 RepID=A0ACB6Z9W3_THEGA|nr:hypothetical protein BDM02DRAFT_3189139 [Thelephora ganbajun]
MSSRLQPRRSVKTVMNYYEDAQESEDDYDYDDGRGHSAPNPQRGKSKPEHSGSEAKQTRRRSGRLSKLPAMPLDVMYEIFSLLHPRDLLRMSWTTKAFRGVLTDRSSKLIWKMSLASVDELPPCPRDLAEPAYAALLFGPYCSGCAKPRSSVVWEFRRRFCKPCLADAVIDYFGAWNIIGNKGLHATLKQIRVHGIGEFMPRIFMKVAHHGRNIYYLKEDIERFADEALKMQSSGRDLLDLVNRCESSREARSNHVSRMEAWERLQAQDKKEELKEAKFQRLYSVLEKLFEEGWGDELSENLGSYCGLDEVTGVGISKPLTEKGWAEIKAPVLAFMESRKARRVSQEQRERLNARVATLRVSIFAYKRSLHPTDDFIPLVSDVCWVPDILDTILNGDDESFVTLVEGLPDRLPQLSTEIYRRRAEQITSILPWEGAMLESLELATAWFTCWLCNVALRHQEVFKHLCFRTCPPEVTRPQMQLLEFTGNPWASPMEKLLFAEGISKAIRKVVLTCGGDPDKMTCHELDDIPCRIAWFQGVLSLQVIDWRQLVRKLQVLDKEKGKGKDVDKLEWRVLKPDELSEFRQCETPSEKKHHSVQVVTNADYYREVRNRRDVDFYREPQPADEGDKEKIADVMVDEVVEE